MIAKMGGSQSFMEESGEGGANIKNQPRACQGGRCLRLPPAWQYGRVADAEAPGPRRKALGAQVRGLGEQGGGRKQAAVAHDAKQRTRPVKVWGQYGDGDCTQQVRASMAEKKTRKEFHARVKEGPPFGRMQSRLCGRMQESWGLPGRRRAGENRGAGGKRGWHGVGQIK